MAAIEVGDRVLVDGKLGVVRYAGLTEFCSGLWYGIELDKCEGFNDGSVEGKRYFNIPGRKGNYGLFAQLEDLSKIDDCGGLRDENRKLTSVVEALERKIRQLHLQRSELKRDSEVLELQRTVKSLVQERAERIEKQAKAVEENKQLHATIKLLQAELHAVASISPGKANSTEEAVRKSSPDELNGLNAILKTENDRLANELNIATRELIKLKEDNRQYEALHTVYIDIEKELQDQLSTLENYILAEGERRCGSATIISSAVESSVSKAAATKAKLYDELYTAVFPDDMPSLQLLELQYDILQKSFANAPFDLSIQSKLTGQLYFLVLRGLANEESTRPPIQFFDVLRNEFGNNGIICSELLLGHLRDDMLKVRELIDFLKDSDSLDSDFRLVISSLSSIFGEILPQLLSDRRKENSSEDLLRSIHNLYSVSLAIEERSRALGEKAGVDPAPATACHIRLSHVLEVVFSMIRYVPGSDVHPFEEFKPALEEILADLKQSETDSASAVQYNTVPRNAGVSFTDSQAVTENPDLDNVADLESELLKKEARIEELAVKIQLLEIKLQESHTKKAALVQKEAEKMEWPKEDDLHSDAQPSTGLKMESSVDVRLCSPLTASQLEALAKQSINSEIVGLQRVVASLTKHQRKDRPNFSWLYEGEQRLQAPTTKAHIEFKNKLSDLTTSALEVADYARMVDYQEDSTDKQKKYIPNAVFKQNVLNLKIKDISA
ncbi:hypothetical protein HG536_0A08050 [Torulaspora globosa]|uniref:CAP-Gly domain-containing protein n=1 Tax=Torulaspora globosa TaxID=48254 RepID=A0A7G3ZBV4_9SACH|nr:uncharacterized protein HG536_0A08050 [Torulaspora globosa]QLL30990.1 hypothetical protein HG536_0A08050 [Torulaspora globosa]